MDVENSGVQGAVEEGKRYENIVSTVEQEPIEVVAKPAEEAVEEAKDEQETDDEAKEVQKRKRGGFQKKLEQREARIAELEAQLAKTAPKESVPQVAEKPKLDSYDTYEAYYEALADWKVEQRFKDQEVKSKQEAVKREQETAYEAYVRKTAEFKTANKDFDDAIAEMVEADVVTDAMQQAIVQSDMGPEVAYYLAKHPEEAERLSKLGFVAVNKAIGRIEERIEASKSSKPVVKTTNAPPPVKPISGANARATAIDPYSGPTEFEAYKAWREKNKR
jgi:hypothetical protein